MHWYVMAKRANWQSLSGVRSDVRHADPVGLFTVFNVAAYKCRLITVIKYRWKMIYLHHILGHAEYTNENAPQRPVGHFAEEPPVPDPERKTESARRRPRNSPRDFELRPSCFCETAVALLPRQKTCIVRPTTFASP
jgi:mRNA interferase HigB